MALGLLAERISEAYADPRLSARRMMAVRLSWSDAATMVLLAVVVQFGAQLLATNLSPTLAERRAAQTASSERPAANSAGQAEDDSLGGDDRRYDSDAPTEGHSPSVIADLARTLLLAGAVFMSVSIAAWFFGNRLGGSASFDQVVGLVGWHTLVSAPVEISVLALVAVLGPAAGGLSLLLVLGVFLYLLYIFAAFIAEAHGFKQVGMVMAASFGIGLGGSFMAMLLGTMLGIVELP